MGPITLFDKSFLEMLNADEAAIFDALYSANICPIFYAEALADLSKQPPGSRSVEQIVRDLAKKTPVMHSVPNLHHSELCLVELSGHPVSMRGVPARAGGIPVKREGLLVKHLHWRCCLQTKVQCATSVVHASQLDAK